MPKARLNYSISIEAAEALDAYCASTGRKAADVARQVILDHLEEEPNTLPLNTVHPKGRRADIWVQSTTINALDHKARADGHVSRSALIDSLLLRFLHSRNDPKFVSVTLNVPHEHWQQLGSVPAAAILRAIEAMVERQPQKECV